LKGFFVNSASCSPQAKQIRIRPADADDVPAIARVLFASFKEYRTLYTESAFAVTTPRAERIAERIAEGAIWVALHHNAVVGTVSAKSRDDGLYIHGMAVSPLWRGQKVGWRLLEQAEAFARKAGAERLYLSTTPFLSRAIALYKTYGFVKSDEGPHGHRS
jgi:N-acetylglutamate synthase-like GNAT family acetyltransferase